MTDTHSCAGTDFYCDVALPDSGALDGAYQDSKHLHVHIHSGPQR